MSTTPYRLRARRPVTAASTETLLGPPVRTFYGAATRNVVWAASPFVLLLGYGVWLAHQGLLDHWFNSTFSVGAVAALFAMSIALIVYTSAFGGGELVRVHANGILDLRVGPRAIRWDEMESLTVEAPRDGRPGVRHLLRTTDGVTLSLGPSIGGVADLVDEVRVRMAEHHLPSVRARIAEGEAVRFGAMTACEQGIAVGPRVVAWDEVAEVEAEAEEIVLRGPEGQRVAAAKLAEVPNAFLLAEMAHARRTR
ncbi:MAG TPA: DUF6585 family protein [Polyangiaceae bacterium]|jgi:hypothetical protein